MKQFTKKFLKFEKHQMLEKLRRACVHHTKLGYGLKKKKKSLFHKFCFISPFLFLKVIQVWNDMGVRKSQCSF